MKKTLIFLFSSIFLFGFSIGLTSCGKHEHICSNWQIISEATCTTEGLKKGICDDCGEELTQVIEIIPHDFDEGEITIAPSCTAEGTFVHACKVCGTVEQKVLEKIPHNPVSVIGSGKNPTCTEPGLTGKIECSVCHVTIEEQKTISPLGHTFNDWIVTKTEDCGIPGSKQRQCSVCQHIETEEIEAKQHIWGEFNQGTPGKHFRICQNNPEHILEDNCTYSSENVVKPTCTTPGFTLEVCLNCGSSIQTHLTDALNHKFGNWISTITEGEEDIEDHKHQHYHICERENCGYKETLDCKMQNTGTIDATCTTPEYIKWVCPDCEAIHEEITQLALGHNLEFVQNQSGQGIAAATHYQHCTKCSFKTESSNCELYAKNINKATCTDDENTDYACTICLKEFNVINTNSALGHQYKWQFTGDKANPTHKGICEREDCRNEISGNCEMETIESNPTCTADGQITETCRICNNVFTEKGVVSTGHNWAWTSKTLTQHTRFCDKCGQSETNDHSFHVTFHSPATCTEQEYFEYECSECNHQKTELGEPGFGHVWHTDSITIDEHHQTCSNCNETKQGPHNYENCNLCADCGLDCLTYKIQGQHCIVTNTNKVKCPTIIIPEYHKELDGSGNYLPTEYKVTEIAGSAFRFYSGNNIYTVSVTIPSSIEIIGDSAFLYCRSLKEFIIEGDTSNLKTIGNYAFNECPLLTDFEAPESIISIGDGAFQNCTSLAVINVKNNDKIEYIGTRAFFNTAFANKEENWIYFDGENKQHHDALYIGKHLISARQIDDNTTFSVIDGTISISASAFSNFVNLSKISLPSSLKYVDNNAFQNCHNIAEVDFRGDVKQWLSISFKNELASPLYHSETGLHIENAHSDIDLSELKITKIPAGTFKNTIITSIILPDTLIEIGREAFKDCKQLTSITFLGDKVEIVGVDAFDGCNDNAFTTDEKGVKYVDYILVKAPVSLEGDYKIKSETRTIAQEAFKDCNKMTKVTIVTSVNDVGIDAFAGCTSMTEIEFEGEAYYWMIFIKDSIGRAYNSQELTWSNLKAYTGSWSRLYKFVPKENLS